MGLTQTPDLSINTFWGSELYVAQPSELTVFIVSSGKPQIQIRAEYESLSLQSVILEMLSCGSTGLIEQGNHADNKALCFNT